MLKWLWVPSSPSYLKSPESLCTVCDWRPVFVSFPVAVREHSDQSRSREKEFALAPSSRVKSIVTGKSEG